MHETPPGRPRTRSAGALVRRRAALAAALGVATLGGGAACGAFSLNEVVDGGTPPDGPASRDGASEGSTETGPPGDTGTGDTGSNGPCDAGSCACTHPTLVASSTTNVRALSVVDGYLYWLAAKSAFDPTFHRLAATVTDASSPPAIAPPVAWTSSDGLAITSGYVYVGAGNTNPGVENIPLEGGSAYAHVISKIPDPVDAIRATPGGIYWTNASSEICHAELDGGMPGPSDSGCGGKPLVAAAPGGSKSTGNDLAITNQDIYLAVAETGEIRVSPISGPGAKVVVTRSPGPRAIFAGDADIVWGELNGDGGIYRSLPDGGGLMTLAEATLAVVNENQNNAFPLLLVDVDFVYYVNSTGQIYAVPRTGGPATLLACDSFSPSSLAVDDTFLYWGDSNQVSKVPKAPK